mmetsp:Transcript_54240/g.79508  ORF Transcript_54240/g.79508 Transcript_54240/m.79508 type:complete len:123 (+) Transcript_54240:31-399(+)
MAERWTAAQLRAAQMIARFRIKPHSASKHSSLFTCRGRVGPPKAVARKHSPQRTDAALSTVVGTEAAMQSSETEWIDDPGDLRADASTDDEDELPVKASCFSRWQFADSGNFFADALYVLAL